MTTKNDDTVDNRATVYIDNRSYCIVVGPYCDAQSRVSIVAYLVSFFPFDRQALNSRVPCNFFGCLRDFSAFLTSLGPYSRCGDKLLGIRVVFEYMCKPVVVVTMVSPFPLYCCGGVFLMKHAEQIIYMTTPALRALWESIMWKSSI